MLTMLCTLPVKFAYMVKPHSTLGERMKRARHELGLTQEQIAKGIGVSTAAVAQWETGDSKTMRPVNLFRAARILKKSPEWLATGEGYEEARDDLIDAIDKLPADGAENVLDVIQYRIDRAGTLIASEERAYYVALIEEFRNAIAQRKTNDPRGSRSSSA